MHQRFWRRRSKLWNGGWGLHPTQLKYVFDRVQLARDDIIIEFGSGGSTSWLAQWAQRSGATVVSFEHSFVHGIKRRPKNVGLMHRPLVQFNENSWDEFVSGTSGYGSATYVRGIDADKTRLLRTMYDLQGLDLTNVSIPLIVVDGPNGSGRGGCLAALRRAGADLSEAVVLLDDYHHYDYLGDIKKQFNFEVELEVIDSRVHYNFGWTVLSNICPLREA